MSNLLTVAASFFGALSFLFFYWRHLREDYIPAQIFSCGFLIIFGILVSSIVFGRNYYWFWFDSAAIAVGFVIGQVKFKMRLFENLEAAGIGLLVWLEIFLLTHSIYFASFVSLGAALFVVILFFVYYYLSRRYKRFVWYKSGRVGFAGLCVFAIFYIARALVALTSLPVVSLVGRLDTIISGVIAFALFFAIYNLSRK